ncbi:MAG TPA: sigma-70 family RNA polymerase sigma factor [Candidatus Limnocylindria bacterium]|jgi:RNA polymerase sigma-70 factor (ECF subfamily)
MAAALTAKEKDAGLSADARAHDMDAYFEHAYVALRDPLFQYLRRFAASDEDAADLTANTFERALTRLSSYRGDRSDFATWLFRIGRNHAIDTIRRRRPHRALDLLKANEHPLSDHGRPEPELMRNEARRELATHVSKLPPLHRECLFLRYGADMSTREIGALIGKGESATQKIISRSLDRLRESYL